MHVLRGEGGGFCESWYGGGGHLGLWGHGGGGVCLDGCQGGCVGVGTREELQPLPDPAGGGGVGLVEGELLRLSSSLLRGVGEVLLVLLLLLGCHLVLPPLPGHMPVLLYPHRT